MLTMVAALSPSKERNGSKGLGKHPAATSNESRFAEVFGPLLKVGRPKALDCLLEVLSFRAIAIEEIVERFAVGDVEAAPARQYEFAAGRAPLVEHHHRVPSSCNCLSGHKATRPCADDHDVLRMVGGRWAHVESVARRDADTVTA